MQGLELLPATTFDSIYAQSLSDVSTLDTMVTVVDVANLIKNFN